MSLNTRRIAINASILDATPSGLGIYTENLVNAITQLHNDCLIYTSHAEGLRVSPEKVRSANARIQPSQGRWGHLTRLAWLQGVMPLRLVRDQADVFFCPIAEGLPFPPIPQVMVIHDLHPLHFPQFWPQPYYYFRYIVPLLLQRSRAIITISENTRRDIAHFYGMDSSRVHVIPPGYDHNRYKLGIDASRVMEKYHLTAYLLFVGNMLPHKNLDRLLAAFAPLAKTFPHKLVIAGKKDPRYYPALEKEARRWGLLEKFLFLDYLPAYELPALYAGATALVLPSLYEGFGLTALEAMACGTPVVTSNRGSLSEVTGGSAMLFDPENVEEMSHALETVLSDSERRLTMRQKGIQQAAQFSWEKAAMAVLAVLQNVVKKPYGR